MVSQNPTSEGVWFWAREASAGIGAGGIHVPVPASLHQRPLSNDFGSRTMRSQGEIEAAICDIVTRFQQEYMGRGPRRVHTHLVENKLFVHLDGVLTSAEQRLIESHHNGNGRAAELLKQLRGHLVLAGRQTLEAMVREATGSEPINVHHDISTTTGEEVIVVPLARAPACREAVKSLRPRHRR